MTRRALATIGISVLAIAIFAGLVHYTWSNRYGPAQGEQVAAFRTLRVGYLAQGLDLNENAVQSSVWAKLPALEVELMHQVTQEPWPRGHVPSVRVRAFHNGKHIYYRLEWADEQADYVTASGRFVDACSVAMPVTQGPPSRSIMMGFDSLVNFWHWRADINAELWDGYTPPQAYSDHHYPFETEEVLPITTPELTTPVTDTIAARPGSLSRKPRQMVEGRGVWREGTWYVVIKRDLRTDAPDSDVQIRPGLHSAAFAAWNGQNDDRGARKSISDWVILDIAAPAVAGERASPKQQASLWPGILAEALADEDERPREITVLAKRFEYIPSTINLRRGELVTLRLEALDVTHGLYLDGYGVKMKAQPGSVDKVTFRADKPGRFSFRCSETCGEFHPYMIGFLSVTPNRPFQLFILLTAATTVLVVGHGLVHLSRKKKEATQCQRPM